MHGFNPLEFKDAKAAFGGEPRRGFHNLFGTPTTFFTADGLVHEDEGTDKLTALLKKLTRRKISANDHFWPVALEPIVQRPGGTPPLEVWENPNLPSGYTYLLQLVAHDLVASTVSLSVTAGRTAVENARDQGLMLDTLYGGGPELTPDHYEYSDKHHDSEGLIPRTRLRLGPLRPVDPGATHCIHRDIARGTGTAGTENCRFAQDVVAAKGDEVKFGMIDCDVKNHADDSGRRTDQQELWRTEAKVADCRNDSHALLSQLTVLFHTLHNTLMKRLEAAVPDPPGAPGSRATLKLRQELAWRRFLCARVAVTLIYRRIIRNDLMKKLLHEDVYKAYDSGLRLDTPRNGTRSGVALEFSHGAFRCGHAMVRDGYRTNRPTQQPLETTRALLQSRRFPGLVPVTSDWLLDWRLFFEIDPAVIPNYSGRLGPRYANAMHSEAISAPESALGLPFLDHISSGFAGLWSVPALMKVIKQKLSHSPLATIFSTYDLWQAPFSSWLGEDAGRGHLSVEDKRRLANDPPLSLFVLFEAAHTIKDGAPVRTGGGARLGPLGSIIVAETIFGALDANKVVFENNPTLHAAMCCCCDEVLGAPSALADVAVGDVSDGCDINEMKDLILFLSANKAFPAAGN